MTKETQAVAAEGPHYGKDCPVGMVQVEFVGCSPEARNGAYGWKPVKSAFLEVYVDGQRFRIDVGDFNGRRGIHVCFPMAATVDQHSANALDIYLPVPCRPCDDPALVPEVLQAQPQCVHGERWDGFARDSTYCPFHQSRLELQMHKDATHGGVWYTYVCDGYPEEQKESTG